MLQLELLQQILQKSSLNYQIMKMLNIITP
jgi:hypothetical protein